MTKDRKLEHIQMAFESQTDPAEQDRRFVYEPMLSAHPTELHAPFEFAGKTMKAPVWISSMTGGTQLAGQINHAIAYACKRFGLGMGLGSCRKLLDSDTYWKDFDVRDIIGSELPFWANLGIAQVDELISKGKEHAIEDLIGRLRADGLIVHVNPFQEWFQPEGDRIRKAPIQIIYDLMDRINIPIIVKEVGQGFGPESLRELLQLPLEAIEFGAYGGTNFSKLEMMRNNVSDYEQYFPFAFTGQTAEQMVIWINQLKDQISVKCPRLIISGGIKNFLDGYYLTSLSRFPAVYGMASGVLKYALESDESLCKYIEGQLKGYGLAQAYLRLNPDYEG